jgi:hypothetical protein
MCVAFQNDYKLQTTPLLRNEQEFLKVIAISTTFIMKYRGRPTRYNNDDLLIFNYLNMIKEIFCPSSGAIERIDLQLVIFCTQFVAGRWSRVWREQSPPH